MATNKTNPRIIYALFFALLLIIEVMIALFVRDDFIRPYGGDILVTMLICCFARIFFPRKIRLLPLWVLLFSFAVEIGQLFDFVSLLGLSDIAFFRILLGSVFSFADLVCYAAGCLLFFIFERAFRSFRISV